MSNVVRTGWEDKYYMSIQNTGITTAGIFTASGKGIPATGQCGLLLSNHPNLETGITKDFQEKTTGLAQNRYDASNAFEYSDGKRSPNVQLEMGLTDHRLAVLGWLLFQKGASEDGSNNKTLLVPTSGNSGCEVWASVGRSIGDGASANGHVIHGMVCKQLQISGNAGERIKLTADMIGRTYADNFNFSTGPAVWAVETDGEEMFFGFTWTLAGTAITSYVESVEITIANNMAARFYSEQVPSAFVVQRFATNGSLKIAMSADTGVGDNSQIDAFVAGTLKKLIGAKGSAGSANYYSIQVNCMYTGATVDPAEELMLTLPFDGVYLDSSNESIKIITCDGVLRGIT